MIRTEREYQAARRDLAQAQDTARVYRESLEREGASSAGIERLMAPAGAFSADLEQEVREYERLRAGRVEALPFASLGRLLIGLRIAKGRTQRDLAQRLSVHESVVSRDERNEYHGITVERAQRVLDALGESVNVVPATAQVSLGALGWSYLGTASPAAADLAAASLAGANLSRTSFTSTVLVGRAWDIAKATTMLSAELRTTELMKGALLGTGEQQRPPSPGKTSAWLADYSTAQGGTAMPPASATSAAAA